MRSGVGEILFRNGAVFDGTRFLPAGTSVLVRAGRITEVGRADSPSAAEAVDLAGGTLLPGFIDAHARPVFAGYQLRRCELSGSERAADYIEIVAAYARDHPDEEWITGGGWAMTAFPGGIPTRHQLDAVVADRPVFLQNRDGHGSWVNSKALTLAGIDSHTPDPPDGRIERDAGGFRPTSVKMMLDGVAENHTAAMLEPYLDGDGCPTSQAGLDFIDPAERSLLDAGAAVCAGSDWPVSSPDPLLGAHVAVNRSLPAHVGGHGGGPFLPGQRLGLEKALAAYTSGSARVNGLEATAGAVRAGLDADFAVVDADLSVVPPGEICEAAVRQTWIGGQLVYEHRDTAAHEHG